MNSFTLKLIACISMLIDHTTAIFVQPYSPLYIVGRGIGRIAFPIFCFLVVEGFFHTRSVKKYLLRLGVFALISEIPFDFALWDASYMRNHFSHQNIFFTLFIGLLTIAVYDYVAKKYKTEPFTLNLLSVITIVAGGVLATLLKTDYSFYGILIILVFYIFHYNKKAMAIAYVLLIGFLFGGWSLLAIGALPLIWFYNGEKGPNVKYAFYAFYPVHLLLLGWIAQMVS